ncbi:cytochrome P450 [Aspergillus karnatakaensis]|uniref:cytochrome P450 n=1 Tax=Aspergillus karnatakaensis TaxID=1810916 RepID=UPI003CCDAB89
MYTILAVTTGAVLLVFYLLVKPVVDYFLDRKGLRKYPAYSPLCALTNLGWCVEAWRGGIRSKKLSELHKFHPVIRIGPNSLSYGHPDAYNDIYGHGTRCVKDTFYQTEKTTHFNLGNVIDKAEHTRKRKMLASAFAAKNLEEWEFKVHRKVKEFLDACDRHCTTSLKEGSIPSPEDLTFDFRAWSNFFTIDAIGEIALSEDLGLLRAGNDLVTASKPNGKTYQAPYIECLHASKIAHTRLAFADKWYHINSKYTTRLLPSYRKLWGLNEGWSDIVNHHARKRLDRYQSGDKLDDIFQYLLHSKNGDAYGLEWGEIAAESAVILDAGSATTAIALNNVIFWLLKNPKCFARLREEIDGVLDEGDIITPHKKVKGLPYLKACLDESLRITPPFSYNLPRRTPAEGAYISGEFIPGHTTVSMSSYVAHRDEEAFPDAERYIPERWLGEKRKNIQAVFVPFSAGSRACIGRNLSYMEQTVMVATLVHRYDFALPSPNWEQERVEVTNLLPGVLPLKVWRREN